MPIYEFYCSGCHTLLNFFSPTVDTASRPACPHCGHSELERRPARFATLRHGGEVDEPSPHEDLHTARMESAMAAMADELDGEDEIEDPRRMGRLMRRFGELSGIPLGPQMEALMARLESGEDLETVERELELLDEADDPAAGALARLRRGGARRTAPRVDDELHFL
jgi:putative FmdB family regulatory protein